MWRANLTRDFRSIAAVGRAARAPRVCSTCASRIPDAPRCTLVGKGVCFDTGGLDIEDFRRHGADEEGHGRCGGALATAQLLRDMDVPLDLRVLVPAVENSVDGNVVAPRRCLALAQAA